MFGEFWTEGDGLSPDAPKEVALADDDARTIYTICCVIHHRLDLLPQTLSPQDILQIAIVADKYDLLIALTHAKAQWLKSDRTDETDIAYLMAAAFVFDDADAFNEQSQALMLHYAGSYMKFLEDDTISGISTAQLVCKWNTILQA